MLRYIGREHIFPAAIGGIQKLPQGYVSDEFNNDISKLEQSFMRESLIAAARQIEGPGKRGSLSERHATKSNVHVITEAGTGLVVGLGYFKLGRTQEIPHIQLNSSTGELTISFNKESFDNPQESIKEFSRICQDAEKLNVKTIIDDRLGDDIVLFGIEAGVEENFEAFFVKHPANSMEIMPEKIKIIGTSVLQFENKPQAQKYWPSSKQTVKFDTEYFRIYGKIAFNFLASLKGGEFVRSSQFDPVRNWIAYGGKNEFAFLDNSPCMFQQYHNGVTPSIHYVILFKTENVLAANISFYGALKTTIFLADNYTDRFDTKGLICNWKSHKEYTLMEYLALIASDISAL